MKRRIWIVQIEGYAVDIKSLESGESYPLARDTRIVTAHATWGSVREQVDLWIKGTKVIMDRMDPDIIEGEPNRTKPTMHEQIVMQADTYLREPVISCCFGQPRQLWIMVGGRELEFPEDSL